MNSNRHLIQYILFISIWLTSCAGGGPEIMTNDIINLHRGTASWIIDGCMAGQCGSQMFVKDSLVVYARPLVDNVAFVVTHKGIPVDKLTGLTGNLVNCETWQGFKDWLINNGFTIVSGGAPAYRLVMEFAATISTMELVPIFSVTLGTPGELPAWIVGEQGDL